MGRFLFIMSLFFYDMECFCTSVFDHTANINAGLMLGKHAESIEVATKMATTAKDALDTARKTFSQIQTLNSVLGSPISSNIMGKLSGLKGSTSKYAGLLGALSGKGGDLDYEVSNLTGNKKIRQFSQARRYIKGKYFREKKPTISLGEAKRIRYQREQKAERVVVDSLVVTKTYKENLVKDQKDFQKLSQEAYQSGDVNHHILVQTKLLEKIAQSLDKLILLQTQHLEFMAHTYLGDRGVGLGEAKNPEETTQ